MTYKKMANDYGKQYLSAEIPTAAIVVLAYEDGFKKCIESAIDRVKYSRFSILLRDDDYTRGYIMACQDIENRIKELQKEQS